ncbi:MAG: hypothetical protein WCD72_06220 [Dehalococcoidia bacterium]
MILVTRSSLCHREEQERRGDLGGMMLRLPRGVYPEIYKILHCAQNDG